jgi:ribose transport system ATP-binding protein
MNSATSGKKQPVLSTAKIGKEFNGVWVLKDIDFDLYGGEIHALAGENGAGKSTFIKILSGIYDPSAGCLSVDNEPRCLSSVAESEHAGIRTVHQEINLVPFFRVYQNMFIGDELSRSRFRFGALDDHLMIEKAREVIKLLDVKLDVNEFSHLLDASMERVVQIGQVLLHKPRVLIFDEPTTSLGEDERKTLLRVITALRKTGIGIIYITHNLEEIMQVADRVTVFRDGQKTGTLEGKDIEKTAIISLMVGHDTLTEYKREFNAFGEKECVLAIKNLTNKKLHGINLSIRKGEILGIAGVVGAGKSEIARCLFGIDKIDGGSIEYKGKPYIPSLRRSLREGIALVPEERKVQGIIENYSVLKNTTLAYLKNFCTAGLIRNSREKKTAEYYMRNLSIKATSSGQLLKTLSGGNQQKVILSRWLVGDFYLGIFDEPTKGIDIQAKEEIYLLLDKLATEGKAILFLSSYLPELITMCDRILVIKDGQNRGEFYPDDPDLQKNVMHAMLGGTASEKAYA